MMKLPANYCLSSPRFARRLKWASVLLLSLAVLSPVHPALAQSVSSALHLNDSGEAVTNLQRQLLNLGYYSGEITGFYGAMTQEAVIRFQQSVGLTADGVVGAATQSALLNSAGQSSPANAATPQPLVHVGDSGAQIAELQKRLTDLGFYSGAISGTFDRQTEDAVARFQQANGLPVDGIVGPATEVALRQPAGQAAASGSSANSTPGLLRLGDTGAAVSELQAHLTDTGFYRSPITGNYDASTQAAVMAFQQSRGLIPDGIAGPQVATALGMATVSPQSGSPQANSSQTGYSQTSYSQPGSSPQSWQQIQQAQAEAQQAQTQAAQAKQEAEQARLEAEQARLVLNQNLQEGRYSVAALQRYLKANGYMSGDITGVLTPDTRTGITEAQHHYGLSNSDLGEGGSP